MNTSTSTSTSSNSNNSNSNDTEIICHTLEARLAKEIEDLVRDIDSPKQLASSSTRKQPTAGAAITTKAVWKTTAEREEPILILLDFIPSIAPMTIQQRVVALQREHRRRLTNTMKTKVFDARRLIESMPVIDDLPTVNLDVETTTKDWTIDDVRNYWNRCDDVVRARCLALQPLSHIAKNNGNKPVPREGVDYASLRDPFRAQREKEALVRRPVAGMRPDQEAELDEDKDGKKVEEAEKSQAGKLEPSETDGEGPLFVLPKDQIPKKVAITAPPGKVSTAN